MEYIFVFDSTHIMMEAEETLKQNGLAIRVMSLPSQIGAGCGLCIRVNPEDLTLAKDIMQREKLEYTGIYEMHRENGRPTYKKAR